MARSDRRLSAPLIDLLKCLPFGENRTLLVCCLLRANYHVACLFLLFAREKRKRNECRSAVSELQSFGERTRDEHPPMSSGRDSTLPS